jgi:hypothetical protein
MTRKERDHERYLRQRDERLKRQREYYATHREQCRESVRNSERKRFLRELLNEPQSYCDIQNKQL